MSELSHEQTVEAAKPIKEIAELARKLDVEYLTKCVEEMKKNHSFRDAAMVLNPNPHIAIESQDLDAAKIKGLELMIGLAKNQKDILDATIKLHMAKENSNQLAKMFGL